MYRDIVIAIRAGMAKNPVKISFKCEPSSLLVSWERKPYETSYSTSLLLRTRGI